MQEQKWTVALTNGKIATFLYFDGYNDMERFVAKHIKNDPILTVNGKKVVEWGQTWVWMKEKKEKKEKKENK
jgi:hypothetical protein